MFLIRQMTRVDYYDLCYNHLLTLLYYPKAHYWPYILYTTHIWGAYIHKSVLLLTLSLLIMTIVIISVITVDDQITV